MKMIGELLTRHRNTFLLVLLASTLILGSRVNSGQNDSVTVEIPVTATAAQSLSPLEVFRQQREQTVRADISTLERLIAQEKVDAKTRQEAASKLQEIIHARQIQSAIEGALTCSSLYPCTAVYQGGILTVVTEKSTVTERDTALVITLAKEHGGISPEDLHIICGK